MKILSFNLYGINRQTVTRSQPERPVDGTSAHRGPLLRNLLEGEDIDIAGFQEMQPHWRNWIRENLSDIYESVSAEFGDHSDANTMIYRKDRFIARDIGSFYLVPGAPGIPAKSPESHFARVCLWVVLKELATEKYFLFLATHLDTVESVKSEQARVITDNINALREAIKTKYRIDDCQLVLVGDMNSQPDSEQYAILTSALRDSRLASQGKTMDGLTSTSPGFWYCENEDSIRKNGHIIDYVFVTERVAVKNYTMIHAATNLCPYGAYISDHNAVIAEIELPQNKI
ncbi:MAG: endonuclease/exonuclease/phosphatase family protein [Clostridia bacterium]|nr:endonuclease/exonuclease/phosphatase family protein [Clostridia bacterium]